VLGVAPQALPVTIASCATLTELLQIATCGARSSYLRNEPGSSSQHPGQLIRMPGRSLRIPGNARTVSLRPEFAAGVDYLDLASLILTPGAAARAGLGVQTLSATAWLNPDDPVALDHVSDAVASIDPLAEVTPMTAAVSPRDLTIDKLRRVLTAGAVAVLLVIGASLLVSVAEQLRERRRVLAVMAAFGTRGSTLACSVLWQTALPVVLGLTLAIVLGAALGAVLMAIAGLPIGFDWGSVALLAGAGLAVVAGVTGLTLPILQRQTSPEALRAE
jgi:hypothetical protein